MQIEQKIFYYYRFFFNFNYYLFLSPYRVKFVNKFKPYVIVKNRFHEMVCLILHITLLLFSIILLWGSMNYHDTREERISLTQDPLRLFQLARAAGFPAYTFAFFVCIWFKKKKFIHLLQLVPKPEAMVDRDSMFIMTVTTVMCLVALFLSPFVMIGEDFLYDCEIKNGTTRWTFNCIYSYSGTMAHNLFLTEKNEPLTLEQLSPGMAALTIIYGFLNVYMILVIHYADCFVLVAALAIHSIGKELNQIVLNDERAEMRVTKLVGYYGQAKVLIDIINEATGPIVVSMFFVTIPYIVENLTVLFEDFDDWALKVRFTYYLLHYFTTMIIGAEGNRLLNELKTWTLKKICKPEDENERTVLSVLKTAPNNFELVKTNSKPALTLSISAGGQDLRNSLFLRRHCCCVNLHADSSREKMNTESNCRENQNKNNNGKLTLVYLDLMSNNVGVKGCGFCTLTFGFLGSIVSILLSYFIVMSQFKSPYNTKATLKQPAGSAELKPPMNFTESMSFIKL